MESQKLLLWTDISIPGFRNIYTISNEGQVYNKFLKRYLTQTENNRGFLTVRLARIDKGGQTFTVHSLVMRSFKPEEYEESRKKNLNIRFKDGNVKHVWLDNLEFVSVIESKLQRPTNKMGVVRGETSIHAKLTEDMVYAICELYQNGLTTNEVMDMLDLGDYQRQTLEYIRRGISWKHISKKFDWGYTKKVYKTKDETIN